MEFDELFESSYEPLSLVPQPLKYKRPGQISSIPADPSLPRGKRDITAAEPFQDYESTNWELVAARELVKEKYQLGTSYEDATTAESAGTSQPQRSVTLLQRQHVLQHLAKFKQRAAAIRSTAAAVQDWFEGGGPAAAAAADALPSEALHILNAEANKGLLHMLSTGLVPSQVELTPGLCGRPDAPLYIKQTQLHRSEARHAATLRSSTSAWQPPKPQVPQNLDAETITALEAGCVQTALPGPSASESQSIKAATMVESSLAASAASVATADPPLQGYEHILNTLSEHQLLIFRGSLVQDTPQVLSFITIAAPVWHAVSVLLSQLESVCRVFRIPLAVIEGKEVLQLAHEFSGSGDGSGEHITGAPAAERPAVGVPELLCCIANLDELECLLTSVSEELAAGALAGPVKHVVMNQETPPLCGIAGDIGIPEQQQQLAVAPGVV